MSRVSMRSGVTLALAIGALAGGAQPALAGAPPKLLDSNFFFFVPSPRIHNLFWDAGWNAHNRFSTSLINGSTATIATGGYLNGLGQYGVGAATFASSTLANSACGATRAPNSLSTASLLGWVECEVTNPFSGAPLPAPRLPTSNDLYVVYLPQNTTITDGGGRITIPQFTLLGHTFGSITIPTFTSCTSYAAYHAPLLTVFGWIGVAIVPTICPAAALDATILTRQSSHEIVETILNPLLVGGWIDNSFPLTGSLSPPFTPSSNRYVAGEAGDLCGTGVVSQIEPTLPAQSTLPSAPLGGSILATYWSNSQNKCLAGVVVGKFRLGRRVTTTRPGSTTFLRVTWIAPHRWRDLRTVEVEVLDGTRVLGVVRFINDGSKTGLLGLGRATGKQRAARVITRGSLSLVLAQSSVATSGPTGKTVTIDFALRFARKLVGHSLTLELGATDQRGNREPFRAGGAVAVR